MGRPVWLVGCTSAAVLKVVCRHNMFSLLVQRQVSCLRTAHIGSSTSWCTFLRLLSCTPTSHWLITCPLDRTPTDQPGQTSWSPPEGVFIVPRQAAGEWWELADTSRGNRSYFYNTLTKKTQWTRPGGDAFVIPLGLIQGSVTRLGRLGRLDTPPVSWSLALTVS